MHGSHDEVAPLSPPFEIVLRGFDRQQVIDHVSALKTRVATIGAERDAALRRSADLNDKVEQLRREAAEATKHIDSLRQEAAAAVSEIDRLQRSPLAVATARIQRMLQMAEDEAAELKSAAERETTSLRESTRAETGRLLAETTQRCERLEAEAQRRWENADSEFEMRRQQAEQHAEREITRRRAETDAWVRDHQTRSIAALHLIIKIAAERLNSRVAKVTRQVSAAKQLRFEVTSQLSEVHSLLVEALGVADQLTATEREQAEQDEPLDDTPPAGPAANAGESDGPAATLRMERPGPVGRPRQADRPTARFGLHP